MSRQPVCRVVRLDNLRTPSSGRAVGGVRAGYTDCDELRLLRRIGENLALGHRPNVAFLCQQLDELKSLPQTARGQLSRLGASGLAAIKAARAYRAGQGDSARYWCEQFHRERAQEAR